MYKPNHTGWFFLFEVTRIQIEKVFEIIQSCAIYHFEEKEIGNFIEMFWFILLRNIAGLSKKTNMPIFEQSKNKHDFSENLDFFILCRFGLGSQASCKNSSKIWGLFFILQD